MVKKYLSKELLINIEKAPSIQDWFSISYNSILDEGFIRKYNKYLKWDLISIRQVLSAELIIEYKDRIDFNLSEDFIREFQDKVSWASISFHQKLSKEFICDFHHKICFYSLMYNKNISDEAKELCITFL